MEGKTGSPFLAILPELTRTRIGKRRRTEGRKATRKKLRSPLVFLLEREKEREEKAEEEQEEKNEKKRTRKNYAPFSYFFLEKETEKAGREGAMEWNRHQKNW